MSDTQKFSINPSIAIIVAGLIVAGAIVYVNQNPASVVEAGNVALPAQANVPAPREGDHVVGDINAPVVLIEYSDFQCPFCSMVYPTLKRLVEESNGQVAWVLRNYPLDSIHPQARPAAMAAECIAELGGNDAFWKYVDDVFNNQDKLAPAYSRQLALQYGIEGASYDSCVAENRYQNRIDAEMGDAIASGGQGTPFTVVWSANYQAPLPGALPYEQFKAVISSVQARQ